MKDIINYYYNLNPLKITKLYNHYYFYINSELYYFIPYKKNIELINSIYEYNQKMLNSNILVNEIILNRDNNPLTFINEEPYLLQKILSCDITPISFFSKGIVFVILFKYILAF